jgi:hypothetical protein
MVAAMEQPTPIIAGNLRNLYKVLVVLVEVSQ